jgi:cell wall-associated NlpC family hydrolase
MTRQRGGAAGVIIVAATICLLLYAAGGPRSLTSLMPGPPAGAPAAAPSGAARAAVSYAEARVGYGCLWGGTGPKTYDCSGLTMKARAEAAVSIERTSQQQWATLPHISASQLRPGGLIFYRGALQRGRSRPGMSPSTSAAGR